MYMSIKGDIVKRFITRGKHVIVFNIIGKGYGFRISDRCNKKTTIMLICMRPNVCAREKP